MKLIFVRHGEPDHMARQIHFPKYEGAKYDLLHLSPLGIDQVRLSISKLRTVKPDLILSSPYTRSLQTAAILSRATDVEIIIEPELHDWLPVQGKPANLSSALIEQKAQEFLQFKATGIMPAHRTWETEEEMRERAGRVFAKYRQLPTLIVSTHEAVIRAVIRTEIIPYGALLEFDWTNP